MKNPSDTLDLTHQFLTPAPPPDSRFFYSERLPQRVGGANVRRSPRLGPVSLRPACPSLLLYDSLTDCCLPLTAPGPPPSLGVRSFRRRLSQSLTPPPPPPCPLLRGSDEGGF
uniref:Uncharacterized protein n=1 Tax=Oryzias latipes TaxID=8090 RepID=A0A3P9J8M8_ORYLA